jgi:hypothetical protein
MKNLLKIDIKTILLFFLVFIIAFQQIKCDNSTKEVGKTVVVDGKKYEQIKKIVDTVYLTKTDTKYVKGKDIYHEILIEKNTPIITDTVEFINDNNRKTVYYDTLNLTNNNGTISIIDTIFRNEIYGRSWIAKINEKTVKETTIVKELPKNQLYVGGSIGFNKTDLIHNISTSLLFKTKKDNIYQLSAGLTNNINGNMLNTPYYGAGIFWKIKLKK